MYKRARAWVKEARIRDKMMHKIPVFCFSLFVCVGVLSAQSTSQCARNLTSVEQAFDQGRLSEIIGQYENENSPLSQCIKGDFYTIEEKIKLYKLVTKSYLFQDNEIMAEEMFVNLLKLDKEHQLQPEDPAELYILKDKFHTEPILRIAVRAGVNKSMPAVMQEFSSHETPKRYNEDGEETGLGIGYWGEVLAEKHVYRGIEVGAGLQFRILTYEVDGNINGLTYLVKNTNSMVRVPLLARYSFNYDKKDEDGNRVAFMPYVFAGASYDILLSARYVDTQRSGGQAFALTAENDNLKDFDQVRTSNVSLFGGAGVRLRTGRAKVNFLSFELRYDNALFNYINPENRWANQDLNIGVGYQEDDLTLNAISISVGYTHSLYLPRKRKQYR